MYNADPKAWIRACKLTFSKRSLLKPYCLASRMHWKISLSPFSYMLPSFMVGQALVCKLSRHADLIPREKIAVDNTKEKNGSVWLSFVYLYKQYNGTDLYVIMYSYGRLCLQRVKTVTVRQSFIECASCLEDLPEQTRRISRKGWLRICKLFSPSFCTLLPESIAENSALHLASDLVF